MTAAGRESAVAEASLLERVAAALVLHDHPFENALTRPDDPLVMVRTDPKFFVCAKALSQAAAVLAALDQPAPGADERAALTGSLEALPCPYREPANAAAWRQGIKAAIRELRILTARAHQPTPPARVPPGPETCPSLCVERSHPGREHDEAEDGCHCWELCEMGPTCPGANAGLDRGCWRVKAATPPAQAEAVAALDEVERQLSERREEMWGDYIGGPGGATEALLQGRFDGMVEAQRILRTARAALAPADTGEGE